MQGNYYGMVLCSKKTAKRFDVLPLLHSATTKNSNIQVQLYIIHPRVTDNLKDNFKAFYQLPVEKYFIQLLAKPI